MAVYGGSGNFDFVHFVVFYFQASVQLTWVGALSFSLVLSQPSS